jgi:uncharacterized protein YidB (DUF937 family)
MGLLDKLGSLTGNAQGQNAPAVEPKVASGFIQALQEHPGGIGALLGTLREHGMGQHVDAWTSGQQQPADPQKVQQALGPTGLIESTAQHAGVPPQVAAMAIGTLLPMVIRHFAPGGHPAPQSELGYLGSALLGKLF